MNIMQCMVTVFICTNFSVIVYYLFSHVRLYLHQLSRYRLLPFQPCSSLFAPTFPLSFTTFSAMFVFICINFPVIVYYFFSHVRLYLHQLFCYRLLPFQPCSLKISISILTCTNCYAKQRKTKDHEELETYLHVDLLKNTIAI